jgi:hypothetical protein
MYRDNVTMLPFYVTPTEQLFELQFCVHKYDLILRTGRAAIHAAFLHGAGSNFISK